MTWRDRTLTLAMATVIGLLAGSFPGCATTPTGPPCPYEENCQCAVPGITIRWKAAHCMFLQATDDLEHQGVSDCVAAADPEGLETLAGCAQNAYWKERLCAARHPADPAAGRACVDDESVMPRIVRWGPGTEGDTDER